jgi:hypothetical protein
MPHALNPIVFGIGPAERRMIDRTMHIEADQVHAFRHIVLAGLF